MNDYGIYKGIILRSYYVDDSQNRTKKTLEYDVQLMSPRHDGVIIYNCRAINSFGGVVNFQECTLQQREASINNSANSVNSRSEYMDNSYVIVAFLEGNMQQSIIIGHWPHPANIAGKTVKSDGARLLGEFNGLRWNINKDGEFIITYSGGKRNVKTRQTERASTADTIIKIDKDGKFSIIDNENQLIKIDRTSKKITIDCDSKATIELDKTGKKTTISTAGDAKVIIDGTSNKVQIQANEIEVGDAALEFIVKATKLKTWLNNKIKTLYNAHIHSTPVGPSGAPLVAMDSVSESDIGSLKHKVE